MNDCEKLILILILITSLLKFLLCEIYLHFNICSTTFGSRAWFNKTMEQQKMTENIVQVLPQLTSTLEIRFEGECPEKTCFARISTKTLAFS